MRMGAAGAPDSDVKELKGSVQLARETEKQHGTNHLAYQQE